MTTTSALARDYAYAFDVRQIDTDAFLGVGVVVPSRRHVSFRAEGSRAAVAPTLSAEVWEEISAWVAESDANLPVRPEAMSERVVAAILGDAYASTVVARRVAAIPTSDFRDAS